MKLSIRSEPPARLRSCASVRPFGRGFWARVLLILVAALRLPAQAEEVSRSSDWNARVWRISDGLTDSRITGIAQTPDGYLWVGTLGKLVRFNGVRFSERELEEIDGVRGRGPRAIFSDRKGNLWMSAARDWVLRVGPDSAVVSRLPETVRPEPMTAFAEGADGTTWCVTDNRLCRIEGASIFVPDDIPVAQSGVSLACDDAGRVWCALGGRIGTLAATGFTEVLNIGAPAILARAKGWGLWVVADRRLLKFDADMKRKLEFELPVGVRPALLCEDSGGGLWLGTTDRGLFRFADGRLEAVETSHLHISCLLEDREGNLWAGTMGGGLNRLRPRTVKLLGPRPVTPYESVQSVASGPNGILWAVTGTGRLLGWNGHTWNAAPPFSSDPCTAVSVDRDGGVWVGTARGGVHHFLGGEVYRSSGHRHHLGQENVRVILAARDGAVWCASDHPAQVTRIAAGVTQVIELPQGTRVVRCLAEGPDGSIWAGTTDGRVLKARGGVFVAERLLADVAPYSVRCLHATAEGVLLIGYAGQGLGFYENGAFAFLSVDDGLIDSTIHQIVSDAKGGVWVASSKGVMQMSLDSLRTRARGGAGRIPCRLVGWEEGLSNAQVHYEHAPSSCWTSGQRIVFASGIGAVEVTPARRPAQPFPPPLAIEAVLLDEREVALYGSRSPLSPAKVRSLPELATASSVVIPPEHRRLEFQFAALSYADAENIRFRYRLEGFDTQWIDARSERSAQYSKLPPGTYTLRVMATHGAGLWNADGASLRLVVQPFYWQTWWFRSAVLLTFTLAVVGTVRLVSFQRLRRELRQAEQRAAVLQERTRIARDIHDDLGGSLTHIKLLSELAMHDTPEPAKVHLRQITGAARQALKFLDETIWAINPRNDRLPDMIGYVGQYVVDFLRAAHVPCEIELPDSPEDLPVRSELRHHVFLVVKEALTNVVKHAAAQKVLFRIEVRDGRMTVLIKDDGRGFEAAEPDASPSSADGVMNMRQRTALLGGQLSVVSEPGGGTMIRLEVTLA